MRVTMIECFWHMHRVGRFEAINSLRDCVFPITIECDNEESFFAINHLERPIVSWL